MSKTLLLAAYVQFAFAFENNFNIHRNMTFFLAQVLLRAAYKREEVSSRYCKPKLN